jgi:alkanesulfonate monooxygenase SsuD/methylene tetrahydromethanopterin reductase-like flavin-dependent oxidoreductase (luciferase family)
MAVLSEHHATADGHLPSPLILASAIAARTKVLNVLVAAAVLPLYHAVRLAEDMAVLDNLSEGRVHHVFGSATAQRNTSTWVSTRAAVERSPTRVWNCCCACSQATPSRSMDGGST